MPQKELEQEEQQSAYSLSRFEAFSDGVFAIAITLLIIEIHVPDLHGLRRVESLQALGRLWPQYLSYAASFAVIGITWLHHHAVFAFVRRINREVNLWNLLLLLVVAFVPFATAVLGDYPGNPMAAVFYGFSMLLLAIAFNLLAAAMARNFIVPLGLLPEDTMRRGMLANRFSLLGYVVGIVLAWNWPYAALGVYCLVAAFYLLPSELDREISRRLQERRAGPR